MADEAEVVWMYTPSFALAVFGSILYGLVFLHTFYLTVIKYRSWFFLCVLVGAGVEVAGYALRCYSIKAPTEVVTTTPLPPPPSPKPTADPHRAPSQRPSPSSSSRPSSSPRATTSSSVASSGPCSRPPRATKSSACRRGCSRAYLCRATSSPSSCRQRGRAWRRRSSGWVRRPTWASRS